MIKKIHKKKREQDIKRYTGKVELVGRIKAEPFPYRKKRLGQGRNSAWRLMIRSIKRLNNLILLMNTVHRRTCSSRRRWRRSTSCLPKWHATKAPNFSIRPCFFTDHRHSWPESGSSGKRVSELVRTFCLFVLWLKIDLAVYQIPLLGCLCSVPESSWT